jgi:hypothetical protein
MEMEHVGVPDGAPLASVMGEFVVFNVGSSIEGVNRKYDVVIDVLVIAGDDALSANVGEDGRTNPGGQIMTHPEGIPSYVDAASVRLDTVCGGRLFACAGASG